MSDLSENIKLFEDGDKFYDLSAFLDLQYCCQVCPEFAHLEMNKTYSDYLIRDLAFLQSAVLDLQMMLSTAPPSKMVQDVVDDFKKDTIEMEKAIGKKREKNEFLNVLLITRDTVATEAQNFLDSYVHM